MNNNYSQADYSFERLKEKNRIKTIMRRVFYCAISLFLCVIFIIGCGAVFLRVKKINVVGTRKTDPMGVVDASGVKADENLYAIGRAEIKTDIMESYPYISDVRVERLLPSTLQFVVTEDKALYYTEICGEYFVLSSSLRVLEKTEDKSYVASFDPALKKIKIPTCIYAVVGDEIIFANKNVIEYSKNLIFELEIAELYDDITSIDFSSRFNIYVMYKNRWNIYLGDKSDLNTKLTFARMMIDSFDEGSSGEIDAHDVTIGSVVLTGNASNDE